MENDRRIEITVSGNTISWSTEGVPSGVEAMAIMSNTLLDMYAYYFEQPARPMLPTQPMRVCIELKEDSMGISYRPAADSATALALCQAAVCGIYSKMQTADFDPLEGVLGALVFRDID